MGLRAGLLSLGLALAGCAGGAKEVVRTDRAPAPIAPYSQGIVQGGFVFVSGQGPTDPKTGEIEKADVRKATRQTLENVKAILEAAGSSLEKVVKVNVYLRDINDFPAMNEVYGTYFKAAPPVRTTIQAAALPGGIPVEIDCIAGR
jgi:2-iminobutanoate/2-iminopropanoate deaminase